MCLQVMSGKPVARAPEGDRHRASTYALRVASLSVRNRASIRSIQVGPHHHHSRVWSSRLRPQHREDRYRVSVWLCVCLNEQYLNAKQPCLQVGHSLFSQSQVPNHQVQGLIGEEALVDCGHAGLAPNVPHVEHHKVLLLETDRSLAHLVSLYQYVSGEWFALIYSI